VSKLSLLAVSLFLTSLDLLAFQPVRRVMNRAELPVPADPYELVAGAIQVPTLPADRDAALSLLRRAADNAISHQPAMNPFDFKVTFVASGKLNYTGQGELTETWKSGQNWRVTEQIGDYSLIRLGYSGKIADEHPVNLIPMRAQMLRNEVMWRASNTINSAGTSFIRTAASQWNGKPVTCILLSHASPVAAQAPSRLWEETEYCIANDTGLLQIHSAAPGTYTVLGYTKNVNFHGKSLPDHFSTFVAGVQVLDAELAVADLPVNSATLLAEPTAMATTGRPAMALSEGMVTALNIPGASTAELMIHAELDADGNITDAELSAASDPKLASSALDAVKQMKLGRTGQSQAYVHVRYTPQ